MEYHFTNDKPIYSQLVDYFKIQILSGERQMGSRVESVRDLALEAKVNPNTMQKALVELEREGLVKTERTSGRFITEDENVILEMRRIIAKQEIQDFVRKMTQLGFSKSDIQELINVYNGE